MKPQSLSRQPENMQSSSVRPHADNTIPPAKDGYVFVFGSNLAGIHGKGAAKIAKTNFGAIQGCGEGRMGMAYGIPTKDARLKVLPLPEVECAIAAFLAYARDNAKVKFFVTRIGCGLAGYPDQQIAPLFAGAPPNCSLSHEWMACIASLSQQEVPEIAPRPRQAA